MTEIEQTLHQLWTAHASGSYHKEQHKPLWQKLAEFVREAERRHPEAK